ncbi:hypothetical protein NCER_102035 [Vairimorpha ceranae BRL01]|uniref:Heat shock protein 70 n=2 Tax=Vairimorpha ceranae TaxID=40302 RepID=C4VB93_VAIC1|nr:heat shock 70 kda protein 4l [Vairimorpha ceranae]EEQ81509.1 hypothetical protein NCER_102035 [Vairimorpha ceranae BRL01]KAF5140337.1 hypothetical protein G9O61_00g014450 [Vairimorpha ceranae]KKO75824.1 heat shock 70 kda protein 4l [Vairimorpha ceranae]
MEFLGIDFGSYKTTLASSKDNGKILGDEQGKRAIPTLLELTSPIRKFGNSITGEHEGSINLRYRNFRDDLSKSENCQAYMMFMKYLDRIIKNNTRGAPSICVSIPSYCTYTDRKFLADIMKCCNMKLERFFNDITAIAMFACLRREKIPEKFMILDFGHAKTEAGIFTYKDFVLTPLYINNIKVGAQNFDNELINLIMRKYSIPDKIICKENILRHLEKLKTVLNSAEVANIQIYINETPINIQVTQEEYIVACKESTNKLTNFINDVIKESDTKLVTEITGGNSSSFLVKNILSDKLDIQSTLDLTESCAIGTALGLACSVVSNKFKMNDIIGRSISIKLENAEKSTEILKKTDLIGTSKCVTYKQKDAFNLEIFEDVLKIGDLQINKESSDKVEAVKITIEVNKLGFIDVKSVKVDDKDIDYKYTTFEMSSDQKEELINTEERYRLLETNIEKIGHMRNELETMAMNLLNAITGNLQELFNEEDEEIVKKVAMDLFDIPSVSEIEEEVKVRDDVIKQLDFVSKKLEGLESSIKEEIVNMKTSINECKDKFAKKSTPSYFKLQGIYYKLEAFDKNLRLDLFTASNFDKSPFDALKNDFDAAIVRAEEELKKMKQEEEEEKLRAQELENKKNETSEDAEKEVSEEKNNEKGNEDKETNEEK